MSKKKKVVVIGGGHGQAAICRGIKNIKHINISAIVTVADDGGSTGRLRRQFHIPAMGDIRNVMLALAASETMMTSLMNYRFDDPEGKEEDIAGHNLGNLILTALTQQCGSFLDAVQMAGKVLNVKGDIIPAGTALYVRSDTKAGLYAFDKAWKAKYIGWDGDYPKPKGHKTDTLVYIAELTPEDSIRLQEKQDYIASLGKNLLKGVPKGGMTVKAKTILTLGREYNKGEWTIGFWPYGGTFIDEHRCYIPGSYVINNENGGKGLVFNFDNTSTTGISNINNRDDANKADTWYTLQGAKLHQKPTQQGVYIHNGKKEIIK